MRVYVRIVLYCHVGNGNMFVRMARVKSDKPVNVHYCGDCAHGNEVQEHWNRALDGHYICVRCKYSTRSRLKSETGCENFKNKLNL